MSACDDEVMNCVFHEEKDGSVTLGVADVNRG